MVFVTKFWIYHKLKKYQIMQNVSLGVDKEFELFLSQPSSLLAIKKCSHKVSATNNVFASVEAIYVLAC